METSALVLVSSAAGFGFFHTLIGVDHSLPFVLLARTEGWSLRKLWAVTAVCGLAHVLSSVVIGTIGIAMGVALDRLEWIESSRGGLAAWALVGLGLAYAVYGIYRSARGKAHSHVHVHEDGTVHAHHHDHRGEHAHAHTKEGGSRRTLTLAGLFLVFVLGPCEVLIPMLLVPAFNHHWGLVALVAVTFGVVTLATMLALVTVGHLGLRHRRLPALERHFATLSGVAIAATGFAIIFLGT